MAIDGTCSLDPEGGRRMRKGIRGIRSRVGAREKHGGLKSKSESNWRKDFWTANSLSLPDGSVDKTKVIYTYCRHEMSYHWSMSSLKYHLQVKHMADADSLQPPAKSRHHHVFIPLFFEPFIFLHDWKCRTNILSKHICLTLTLSYVVKSIKNMKKIHNGKFRTEKKCAEKKKLLLICD